MSNNDKELLKQVGIISLVQVTRLSFGLIRGKLIALLFGASGIGIWSLLQYFSDMVQVTSQLGLEKSTVKSISEESANTDKKNAIIKASLVVFLTSSLTAFITLLIASQAIDSLLFTKIGAGTCIAIATYILLNSNANALGSILNGERKIKSLALSQLFGFSIGNVIIFVAFPFLEASELPYCFIVLGLTNLFSATYFYKKTRSPLQQTEQQSHRQKEKLRFYTKALITSGLAFWIPAVYMAVVEYGTRLYLKQELSLSHLGYYQAAWTLSNMYIGILLASMASTFFPKLCQEKRSPSTLNQLINKQISFSISICAPPVFILFAFAEEIIPILYSTEFSTISAQIIKWQTFGVMLRLIGFPLGYGLMALDKKRAYVSSQILFTSLNALLLFHLIESNTIDKIGLNYSISYAVYTATNYIIFQKSTNFRTTKSILVSHGLFSFSVLIAAISIGASQSLEITTTLLLASILTARSLYVLKAEHGIDSRTIFKKISIKNDEI